MGTTTTSFNNLSPQALGTELLTVLADVKRYDEKKALDLIAAGADVNAMTDHDDTPLSYAAFNGWLPVVRALLDKNARIDVQDFAGETAIMGAASGGHDAVFELLLSKHARLDLKNIFKEDVLHLAAENGRTHIVKRLIALGAALDNADEKGKTPAAHAREKGFVDIAAMIDLAIEARDGPAKAAAAKAAHDLLHIADSFEFGLDKPTVTPAAATFKRILRR